MHVAWGEGSASRRFDLIWEMQVPKRGGGQRSTANNLAPLLRLKVVGWGRAGRSNIRLENQVANFFL